MVGVEPAPLNPLYANQLAAEELFEAALGPLPDALRESYARRSGLMLTGGETGIWVQTGGSATVSNVVLNGNIYGLWTDGTSVSVTNTTASATGQSCASKGP